MSPNIDNPSVRVVRIVELATPIGNLLSHEDQLSCVKVSMEWNQAFIPALYSTMDDSKGAWPQILNLYDDSEANNGQGRAWILDLFKKYGYHIRHLSTQWRVIVDAAYLGQTCTQLRSLTANDFANSYTTKEMAEYEQIQEEGELTYQDRMEPARVGDLLSPDFAGDVFRPMVAGWRTLKQQEGDWYTSQYFWLLIRQNPGLVSLMLGWNLRELFDVSPEYVYTILTALPQLTFLDNRLDSVELDRVLESCPRLQTYHSYKTSGLRCFVGHEWSSLQTLELDMQVDSQELLHLLKSLTGLLHLRLREIWSESEQCTNVGQLLENRRSGLKSLCLSSMGSYWDEWLGTMVLPWLPDLIEYSAPELGPYVASDLALHCKGFQTYLQATVRPSIHYSYGPDPIQNVFRHLMETCSDLRMLDGVNHKIDVEDLESNEWVCSDLEKLRCQFVGFSRLTTSEEAILESVAEESAVEKSAGEESVNEELKERRRLGREQQQTVYNRLSTFTRLRVLDLGYEFRELSLIRTARSPRDILQWYPTFAQPIAGTMKLSLASGLGRLETLKELEVFGFEGADHRIGKSELEWMAVHWPKLKVLRGLQEDDVPGEKYRVEKAVLREHMQMLRPDVKHEAGPSFSSRFFTPIASPVLRAKRPPASMHAKAFDIPELVVLIVSYLQPHDLLACIQVNCLWNSTMIPIHWHTIDDSTHHGTPSSGAPVVLEAVSLAARAGGAAGVSAAVKKFHRYQRQPHGMYDLLARLTSLKHLELGYESRYPWTYKAEEFYEKDGKEYFIYEGAKTFDILEFSLESGLDRLAALKDWSCLGSSV
ncbi:hypothetical protein BGZ47_007369 [Haplosporangium gracile]|nr:hypothetical protein BGZ47_007369 [Haplosporangium gracile]